jgi:ABC-type glycerol-3-phosphate transport system permease component
LTTLVTLTCLLWYLWATFWGPLLVTHPDAEVASLVRGSILLVWRYPAESFVTAVAAAVALVVGMVSIGGLVLIVPVVIVLLHTQRYLDLMARQGAVKPEE